MEIIRIGTEKMKLILDGSDAKRYGVADAAGTADAAAQRRALSRLLDDVGKRTGTDVRGARVVLEAFTDRSGGYEIFLTVEKAPADSPAFYRFSSYGSLYEAARRLDGDLTVGESSALYMVEGEAYVLSLPDAEVRGGRPFSRYSFLEEYGEREAGKMFSAYIREYGVCLCPSGAIPYILAGKAKSSV